MVGNSATVEDPPDPDEPEEDDAEIYLLKDITVPLLRDEKGKPAFVRRVGKRRVSRFFFLVPPHFSFFFFRLRFIFSLSYAPTTAPRTPTNIAY